MSRFSLLLLSVLSMLPAWGQTTLSLGGTVCGNVRNEVGEPAVFVKVAAFYLGAHSGGVPMSKTDETGHYCINNLSPGKYAMSADDSDKGYPAMNSSFYGSEASSTRVSITPVELQAQVLDWQIPYKAATLSIRVTDAKTGERLDWMIFDMAVQSSPDMRFLRGSSPCSQVLLVPPDEDIRLKVSHPGYRQWPNDDANGRLIHLQPGAAKEINVALVMLVRP